MKPIKNLQGNITCTSCGKSSPSETFEAREMFFGTKELFTYHRCSHCGSLWIDAIPEDLSIHYRDGYYLPAPPPIPRYFASFRASAIIRMSSVLAWKLAQLGPKFGKGLPIPPYMAGLGLQHKDMIADIGSGRGGFLRSLHFLGFTNLWGFDPFSDTEVQDGGLHLLKADIRQAPTGFKLITFNHSLEHMPDPVDILSEARKRLTSDGVIVVRLPVAGSYADRTYGKDWVALDPPRHLFVPSQRGMAHIAERAGLKIYKVDFDSSAMQFWGSEQYLKDVSLRDKRSVALKSTAVFNSLQVREFERKAKILNEQRDGDEACYVLRPI